MAQKVITILWSHRFPKLPEALQILDQTYPGFSIQYFEDFEEFKNSEN